MWTHNWVRMNITQMSQHWNKDNVTDIVTDDD